MSTPVLEDIRVGDVLELYGQSTSKLVRRVEWHKVIVTANENHTGEKVAFNRIPKLIKRNEIRIPKKELL